MFLTTIAATSMQRRSVPISACSDSPAFWKPLLYRSSESTCIGSVYRPEANGVTSKVVSHVQFSVSVTPPEQDCSGLAVALRHFSAVHHAGLHCSSQVLMSRYCGQVCARYPRSTDGEYVAAPRCGNYTLSPLSSRDRRNSGVGPARLQAISTSSRFGSTASATLTLWIWSVLWSCAAVPTNMTSDLSAFRRRSFSRNHRFTAREHSSTTVRPVSISDAVSA